mmetsp:Transcript_14278/g.56349  ORF Transcript_14278/g.56349 Transcript_14278/m.56349 type:complete len:233 (+) Transcript_14278:881-1579(+)
MGHRCDRSVPSPFHPATSSTTGTSAMSAFSGNGTSSAGLLSSTATSADRLVASPSSPEPSDSGMSALSISFSTSLSWVFFATSATVFSVDGATEPFALSSSSSLRSERTSLLRVLTSLRMRSSASSWVRRMRMIACASSHLSASPSESARVVTSAGRRVARTQQPPNRSSRRIAAIIGFLGTQLGRAAGAATRSARSARRGATNPRDAVAAWAGAMGASVSIWCVWLWRAGR